MLSCCLDNPAFPHPVSGRIYDQIEEKGWIWSNKMFKRLFLKLAKQSLTYLKRYSISGMHAVLNKQYFYIGYRKKSYVLGVNKDQLKKFHFLIERILLLVDDIPPFSRRNSFCQHIKSSLSASKSLITYWKKS